MIRPARPDEAEAVRQLVHAAYAAYVVRLGKAPAPMLEDYGRRIVDRQVWVLEHGDALAGVLVLQDADGGVLLLDNVAVSPELQGKGHGRALIAFAEQEARRRGHNMLRLYTNVLMRENLALYGRLGFCKTGRISEQGFDRVYMTKALLK